MQEATIKINIDSKNATNNVGKLQDDLQATRQELDRLIKTYGENSKQADNMRKSLAGLEIEMGKLGVSTDEAVGSTQSLKTELRKLTDELATLEPGSARFKELSIRASELKDQIADTNDVVGQLAGNFTERLTRGISSAVGIGIAGFQAMTAAQALFNVESEELQETMVKLQALLNLSQALETFGGLDQKIVEIKSLFGSLTTATQAQAVAQAETATATAATTLAMEGEAVAAGGAAASTSVLGVALNALPLVAIVSAIGLLVAGLINYASASGNAETQEKKRTKALEEQEKQIKKNNEETKKHEEFIVAEAGSFVNLALQLQGSNKGTKERANLIKQINSTYGTTLKNLNDENLFQSQVNKSIEDYLILAEAKYKLAENEDKINKLLAKKTKLEEASNSYAKVGFEQSYDNFVKLDKILNRYGLTSSEVSTQLEEVKNKLNSLTKSSFNLGNTVNTLSGNYDANTGSINDNNDANEEYIEILDKVKNKIDREIAAQQTLDRITSERVDNTLKKEEDAINKQYGDERQNVINRAIEREIEATEEKFKKEGKTEEEYRTQIQAIRDNYKDYLLDSEKNLLNQLETFREEDLTNLKNSYTLQEQIVLNSTQQILENTRLLELEYQKQVEIDAVDATTKTEEVKNKKKIEIRKKYADQEIQLIKSLGQKEQQALDLQLQQTLTKEGITIQEKEQAQAKYSQDTIKLAQDTADKINDINEGIKSPIPETPQAKIDEGVAMASKYVDAIASLYNQLSNVIQLATENQFGVRQDKIDEAYRLEKESLEGALEEERVSREQYDADIERLDQKRFEEEKQLRKEQFEISKKLQISNAIIQGAQAVLAAFSSGAAVPIAGITLGPINAAIAGAIAAAQLAVISNQQFTAAEGGVVPGYGPGNIDSVPSLLAPGEAVINSQSAQMFPNLLSQINEAGGGKSLVPDLPPRSASQQTPNVFVQKEMNQPIKAFVVETDISDSQRRINRIKQSVEF